MRLPLSIGTKAHPSNTTSGRDEVAHFANALAQRDRSLLVLAPGKTDGVDKLLAWLVGDHSPHILGNMLIRLTG